MNSNRIAGTGWLQFNGCAWNDDGCWEPLDAAIQAQHDAGLKPMVVMSGNEQADVQQYSDTLRALTRRYTQFGTFGLIRGIQVWNEPNGMGGRYPVDVYRDLFISARSAIRSVASDMRVISAAPSPHAAPVQGVDWQEYQRRISDFPGNFVLAAHIYPFNDAPILDDARNQFSVSEDLGRPVWVTETGVCTGEPDVVCPRDQNYDIGEARQAQALENVCRMLASRGARAIMITTITSTGPVSDRLRGYGLLNLDASPGYARPAWDAIVDCHKGW